jgi:putative oxidoreductase
MFLNAGLGKISGYAGTQGYMEAVGVPGALLPLVIALEVLGAVAIIVGYRTRIVAASLAAFTVVAAVLFHSGADQMQQLLFMKNLAVAGGFLFLVARGAGDWSLDARRERLTSTGEPLTAVT